MIHCQGFCEVFVLTTGQGSLIVALGSIVLFVPQIIGMISEKPERMFGSSGEDPDNVSSDGRPTYDERLNQILAAATGAIARAGYERASMRSIAKATGVSLAGLYHYFENKEKMLFLIQFRSFSSLLNNLREKLHGVEDPKEQLRVMVRAHLGYFAAHMDALKVCSHELDSLTGDAYEQTRRIRRDYFDLTRSIVDRIVASEGVHESLNIHVSTMALFGTLNWLYRWYDPKRGPAVSAVANQITDQFLNGLLHSRDTAATGVSEHGKKQANAK